MYETCTLYKLQVWPSLGPLKSRWAGAGAVRAATDLCKVHVSYLNIILNDFILSQPSYGMLQNSMGMGGAAADPSTTRG